MARNRQMLIAVGGGVMALTCVLLIVCNALNTWGSAGSFGVTIGLWKECSPLKCATFDCSDFQGDTASVCARYTIARICVTLACILSAFSAGLLFLTLMQGDNANPLFVRLGKILPSVTLSMTIIGVATGISFITSLLFISMSTGSYLAIVTVIVCFTGAFAAGLIPLHTSYT